MRNKITKESLIELLKYTMIPVVGILIALIVEWWQHG